MTNSRPVQSQVPRHGEVEEIVVFKAWKNKPLLAFTDAAYAAFLGTFESHFRYATEAVRKYLLPAGTAPKTTDAEVRNRLPRCASRLRDRIIVPWKAFELVYFWLEGREGQHGGKLRNAIERKLEATRRAPRKPEEMAPTAASIESPAHEENPMKAFIDAFATEAGRNDGLVGSRTLGKMIEAHGVPDVRELIDANWVEPVKKVGKLKVGWYRAGSAMTDPNASIPMNGYA